MLFVFTVGIAFVVSAYLFYRNHYQDPTEPRDLVSCRPTAQSYPAAQASKSAEITFYRTASECQRLLNPPLKSISKPHGTTTEALLKARAIPNQRLVNTFSIDNAFTTHDLGHHDKFVARARKLLNTSDDEWKIAAGFAEEDVKVGLRYFRAINNQILLVKLVRHVAFRFAMHKFFPKVELKGKDGEIAVVVEQINALWIASKVQNAPQTHRMDCQQLESVLMSLFPGRKPGPKSTASLKLARAKKDPEAFIAQAMVIIATEIEWKLKKKVEEISDESTLTDLGIDTKVSFRILKKFKSKLDITLPSRNGEIFWDCPTAKDVKDFVRKTIVETDNPLNLLLPAYETLWRVVLGCFLEVQFRLKDGREVTRALLKDFLESPSREFFNSRMVAGVSVSMMVKEALRLYPPTRRIYRFQESVNGSRVHTVVADVEFLHRDSQIWGEDSLSYRPSRWSVTGAEDCYKSFMPFGYGRHACPAREITGPMMIGILVAAMVEATIAYDCSTLSPEDIVDHSGTSSMKMDRDSHETLCIFRPDDDMD